jgi:hypothetical protein
MNNSEIDKILQNIQQGKKCLMGFDTDETTLVVSIEQQSNGMYKYSYSMRDIYDMSAPSHLESKIMDETELRATLNKLHSDTPGDISYVYVDFLKEDRYSEKLNVIHSILKQGWRSVYVVLVNKSKNIDNINLYMDYNSVFSHPYQAEYMLAYLKKQGVRCCIKKVDIALVEGEVQIKGDLSQHERLSSRQILATLVEMDITKIKRFFRISPDPMPSK